jgi:hypothetical protein
MLDRRKYGVDSSDASASEVQHPDSELETGCQTLTSKPPAIAPSDSDKQIRQSNGDGPSGKAIVASQPEGSDPELTISAVTQSTNQTTT